MMAAMFMSVLAIGGIVLALLFVLGIVVFILLCEGVSEGGIGASGTKATKDEMLEMLGHRKERK